MSEETVERAAVPVPDEQEPGLTESAVGQPEVSAETETQSEGEPASEPFAEAAPEAEPQAEEQSPVELPTGGEPETGDGEAETVFVAEAVDADDLLAEHAPVDTDRAELKAVIEAVIYITDEPLTPQQIAAALDRPLDRVKEVLEELAQEYARPERGLNIREIAGGYKMATKPEHHEAVRAFVKNLKPPLKLSLAALETLAVIAYKQPVTGPEIMEIRGVQGLGVLKTLIDRKLIATAGRKAVVGKPILYKTTREFLVQFGLSDLAELPTLKEFEELGRLALSDGEPDEAAAQEPARAGTETAASSEAPTPQETPAVDPPAGEASGEDAPREEPPAGVDQTPLEDPPAPEPAHEDPPADPENAAEHNA